MKIKISAQEYFEELKLMEKQYGQEEDLYPWIYMLLQMAEYKKRENEGENKYQPVSIRDVHNAQPCCFAATEENSEYFKIRWELTKRVGAPDIAIFNGNDICGCIEIKKFKQNLFEEIKENVSIKLQEYYYILKYDERSKKKNKQAYIEEDKMVIEKDEMVIKSVLEEKVNITIDEDKFTIKIECSDKKKLDEITVHILTNGSKKLQAKSDWKDKYSFNNLSIKDREGQLAGHLDKFKKVLYTNGLEFYYLKLVDNQIKVEKLADLSNAFGQYENAEKEEIINELEKGDFKTLEIKENDGEWTKLIKGLAKIPWCDKTDKN